MNELQAALPAMPKLVPSSWSLPNELSELAEHMRGNRRAAAEAAAGEAGAGGADAGSIGMVGAADVYIVKPAAGLQGHGIVLTTDPKSTTAYREGRKAVVQEYIDPPMLLDGFKFDMRLYVLITSIEPLKVHLYNDGLARLCTTKYTPPDPSNLKARKAHLTNFSINKNSKNFVKGAAGSKRSIKSVWDTMREQGADVDAVWTDIVRVITTACLAVQPRLKEAYTAAVPPKSTLKTSSSTCFEILGFDIMLDAAHKAWLIEVNHAPSFKGGSKVDSRIKHGVWSKGLRLLSVSERRKRTLVGRVRKQWEQFMREQAVRIAVPRPPRTPPPPSPGRPHMRPSLQSPTTDRASGTAPRSPRHLPLRARLDEPSLGGCSFSFGSVTRDVVIGTGKKRPLAGFKSGSMLHVVAATTAQSPTPPGSPGSGGGGRPLSSTPSLTAVGGGLSPSAGPRPALPAGGQPLRHAVSTPHLNTLGGDPGDDGVFTGSGSSADDMNGGDLAYDYEVQSDVGSEFDLGSDPEDDGADDDGAHDDSECASRGTSGCADAMYVCPRSDDPDEYIRIFLSSPSDMQRYAQTTQTAKALWDLRPRTPARPPSPLESVGRS